MKRIFLLLIMTLTLGLNCAKAQTSSSNFMGVWVLQNPELAITYAVVTFYDNGVVTQEFKNMLTGESGSAQSSWSFNSKTRILTITEKDGSTYQGKFLPGTDAFDLLNLGKQTTSDFTFAKPGSARDQYMNNVKMAVELYGNDASLKKGIPSSSRATGYSFQPRYSTCGSCFGTGRCIQCSGTGSVTYDYREYKTCPSCGGTGLCWQCHGQKRIKNY